VYVSAGEPSTYRRAG